MNVRLEGEKKLPPEYYEYICRHIWKKTVPEICDKRNVWQEKSE
jgi:hypothetical protein